MNFHENISVSEFRQLPDASIDRFDAPDPYPALSDADGRVPGASVSHV